MRVSRAPSTDSAGLGNALHHVADLDAVLDAARPDLEAMRGQRILVTGATGSSDRGCSRRLPTPIALRTSIFESSLLSRRASTCEPTPPISPLSRGSSSSRETSGRSTTPASWRRVETVSVDAVIHAAISVDAATIARNPIPTLDTAVEGTRRVLELARSSGVRRFLFLSSGAVYGRASEHVHRFAEGHRGALDTTDPAQVYAEGKRIGEMMCACMTRAYGMETVIARLFAFVGPHLYLDRHYAVGNLMQDALLGRSVTVRGDGTAVRSYQYAADMATWLWALLNRGRAGQAYNVGASDAVSIAQLATKVAALGTPPVDVDIQGVSREGVPRDHYLPDLTLVKDSLRRTRDRDAG